jgi:hypothetical protein
MAGHWWVVAWVLLEVVAGVLVLGIAVWGFFRWDRRYRGAPGGDGFVGTAETFLDPTTGRSMRVFFNAATGQRQYRESPR